MRIYSIGCLAMSLLWCFPLARAVALPMTAPPPFPQEMNFTLEGKITEKNGDKLTISSGENVIFHVRYDHKTEIWKPDGTLGTAQDLRKGLTVSVAGDLEEKGEVRALKIEIKGK